MCATSAANLLLKMPARIPDADRAAIINDFENGRVHILLQLALKMSHWQAYPWAAYGAACCDEIQSPRILEAALASRNSHPQAEMLQNQSTQEEAESFMEDPATLFESKDPHYLPELRRWFGAVRSISVVERRVEGKHATSKKGVSRAPHHSCPYVSLLHRVGEIKNFLEQVPDSIKQLAQEIELVKSGLNAVKLLNLDMHPECEKANNYRDPVYARVIYHADSYVKYRMAKPSVPVDKPPGKDQPVRSLNDCQTALRLELGRRHAKARFQEFQKGLDDSGQAHGPSSSGSSGSGSHCFFSFPMSDGALRTLKSLLVPEPPANQLRAAPAPEMQLANAPFCADGIPDGEVDFARSSGSGTCNVLNVVSGPEPAVPLRVQRLIFCKLASRTDAARAHREKVAGEMSLSNSFAVTTHTVLNVDAARKEMLLSTAPMNLSSASADNVPLMLNPFSLTLSQLEGVRVWKRSEEFGRAPFTFTFSFQYLHELASVAPDLLTIAPGFLKKLMDRPAGIHLGKQGGALGKLVQKLKADEVIVPVEEETLGAVPSLWKLSEKGAQLVETCVTVTGGEKLLCKREPPATPTSMTTFEVVLALEAGGFEHVVVDGKEAKLRKKKPYVQGDPKEWLTKESSASAPKVSHFYLCALLMACDHGKAVPHFGADRVYKEILGLVDEGPKRQRGGKRLSIFKEEFFEMETEETVLALEDSKPKPKPRGRRKQIQAFEKHVENNADSDDAASTPGLELGQMSSVDSEVESSGLELGSPTASVHERGKISLSNSSSSSSTSQTSSSSDSDSDSSGGPPLESESGGGTETEGSGSASSVPKFPKHETRDSRDGQVEPVAAPKVAPCPGPDALDSDKARRERGRFRGESWGVFKIVYFDRKGSTGYQLTCTNPAHNPDGQALCTKSRGNRFKGGTEVCLRMLKQWAILGKDVSSKDAHQQVWQTVLEAAQHDRLVTTEELESSKILSWSEAASASSTAVAVAPAPVATRGKRKRERS